jgi:hypothetical protein
MDSTFMAHFDVFRASPFWAASHSSGSHAAVELV